MVIRAPSGGRIETEMNALLLSNSWVLPYGEAPGERWAQPESGTECAPPGWVPELWGGTFEPGSLEGKSCPV